jgi:hypothetical protein
MKHLKGFSQKDYFVSIYDWEFYENNYKTVDFTQYEMDKIEELAIKWGFDFPEDSMLEINEYDIYKCKDEYFYVSYHEGYDDEKFYKCDQFDGLVYFLKRKKLI